MNSNVRDSAWLMGVEVEPGVVGCLLHSHLKAIKTFSKENFGAWEGVNYGLCQDCLLLLGKDIRFQEVIDEQIVIRLNKLRKEGAH